jgi:hypothetical protein
LIEGVSASLFFGLYSGRAKVFATSGVQMLSRLCWGILLLFIFSQSFELERDFDSDCAPIISKIDA